VSDARTDGRSFDAIEEGRRQWRERYGEAEVMAASTAIMRAQQLILSQLDPLLRSFGLTFARYEALMLLSFTRRGSVPMGKLGERLMIHPTSATSLITRLVDQGYVEREEDAADRRITLARITPEGRRVAKRATKRLVEARFGLAGLTDAEAAQMIDLVRKVRQGAGDLGG
jgi:DNA-binding MarR family transcriptional regulator